MAAFQKLGDYTNGTANDGSEITAEFNNIYNAFNGTSSDKEMIRKLSHATEPAMEFDQLGAGPIIEGKQNSALKFTFDNAGKLVNDNVLVITKSWLYTVLPAAVETVESQPRFIVPSAGVNTITRLYVVWAAGADSGASNVFTIKRRNAAGTLQADVGTVEVNTPAQNAILDNNISDVPLTAGDQIYPLFTTRNTASEQMVTVSIEITVKLS